MVYRKKWGFCRSQRVNQLNLLDGRGAKMIVCIASIIIILGFVGRIIFNLACLIAVKKKDEEIDEMMKADPILNEWIEQNLNKNDK